MINVGLRILQIEDNPTDSALAKALLEAAGIGAAVTCVRTRADFEAALAAPHLDLILSDFSMPGFDGLSALKIARQRRPEVPFIFLSGTIGEELAVESLRQGATDYIIKDRLSRLPSSVKRAVQESLEAARRRRMEERIHEQAALLDQAQDAICQTDLRLEVLYWNKSAGRLYGWAAETAVGRNIHELLAGPNSETPATALQQLIRTGEWQGELQQTTAQGRKLTVESRWTLLLGAADAPKSILMINTDVTEKKQMEARLFRQQRLESLGTLAGGIAHDLNNVLSPVLMGAALLRTEPISAEGAKMLELMANSARRGAEMIKQILAFSRGVSGEHELVNLRFLFDDLVKLVRQTFPGSIQIRSRLAENLHRVTGNSTQLHQVLLNLCVNARDAMPAGGELGLEGENVELATPRLPPGGGLLPGPYLRLKVSDTGHGIDPGLLDKIFLPFFTTKDLDHGTGLGLSTVIAIVKTHGGFVEVSSKVGSGTTFLVYLPARQQPLAGAPGVADGFTTRTHNTPAAAKWQFPATNTARTIGGARSSVSDTPATPIQPEHKRRSVAL